MLFKSLIKLFQSFSQKKKILLVFLIIFMVFGALLEIISLGAILPFLMVLVNPEKLSEYEILKFTFNYFSLNEKEDLLFVLTLIFIIATLISCFGRYYVLIFSTRLSFSIGNDIGFNVLNKTLNQNYLYHLSINSNKLTNVIITKINQLVYAVILPVLSILSSSIVLILILISLSIINYKVTLVIFFLISFFYLIIIITTKKKLKYYSYISSKNSTNIMKLLNEAYSGIKDVMLNNKQKDVLKSFITNDIKLKNSQGSIHIISGTPKFFFEAFGLIILACIGYFLSKSGNNLIDLIPLIGLMVLAAQKSLPLAQQLYSSLSSLRGSEIALKEIISFLEFKEYNKQDFNTKKPITLKKNICLSDVQFTYPNVKDSFSTFFNVNIKKGRKVGVVGKSGSGKSTFIDILMKLIIPKKGSISIDNILLNSSKIKKWQKIIAHVPQKIFLTDSSILYNICVTNNKQDIDFSRVDKVLQLVELYDFVYSKKDKYLSFIGENGKKLSGGQIQRLAIARALYKQPQVLILDESTSALDVNTEEKIINNLLSIKDLTIIFVTHRINAIKNFDEIIMIENGSIKDINTFKKILKSNFRNKYEK